MTAPIRPDTRRADHRCAFSAAFALLVAACLLVFASGAAAKIIHEKEEVLTPSYAAGWIGADNSSTSSGGDFYETVLSSGSFETSVRQRNPDGTLSGVTLNGAETPAGFFSALNFNTFQASSGAKVDGSSGANAGEVFMPDVENGVVDVFDSSGAYVCQITGRATPSASECAGPAGSQTPSGNIVPLSVAIEPADGHLFVGDGRGMIYEFNESGEYVGEITDSHVYEPGSLAFDSGGNLYVTNGNPFFGGGPAVKLDSSGSFVATVTSEPTLAVAVNHNTDRVYLGGESSGITEFSPAGTELDHFGTQAFSVEVDDSSGRVFSSANVTEVWSADIVVPGVTTDPATNVEESTAVAHGEVDPDVADGGSEVESCRFEYATAAEYESTASYGSSVPCSPAPPFASPTVVSANLTGLADSTEYHIRLAAHNANGVDSFGEDTIFITKGAPTVDSESVDHITRFGAEVHASVNPHGYATSYVVQYVDQGQYELDGFSSAQSTAPEPVGAQETPQAVSKVLSGLAVGTKYHYRVVATSSHGSDQGADQTFTTIPIVGLGEYNVTAGLHTAKLQAEVNPEGLETSCKVEWVSAAAFETSGYATATSQACTPPSVDGSNVVEPAVELSGLDLASTYHFRFVLQNSSGTLVGPDGSFGTFGIKSFSIEALNDAEEPETAAGAHPYELVTHIVLNTTKILGNAGGDSLNPEGSVRATGVAKDILAELPPGLIGNPNAVPKCTRRVVEETHCTGDAQVGIMTVNTGSTGPMTRGIFNVYPPQGKPATFASNYFNVSLNGFVDAGIRTGGDYGINAGATNLLEVANVYAVEVRMWGVPADQSHDAQRECGLTAGCASNAEPKPFLRNPTSCRGPRVARALADSWNGAGEWVSAEQQMPAITGCNQLEFEPSIQARPTTSVSDSPTGLHVDIHVPQNEDPEGRGTADLKDAVVTLPQGLVVNPAGANGLVACSPADVDLHGAGPANCPDGSKIGTVEVDSPLVDHPLPGGVYVATPHDNPFDSLLAIYIGVDDPETGVVIKLAGQVEPDPKTGQLKTTFSDNPQLPFDDFKLDFFGGPKAVLRTPGACGPYTTTSALTPWSAPASGPAATPSDAYAISSAPNNLACPSSEDRQPNQPAFNAGTVAPIAGAYSPFVVRLSRQDGTQGFASVKVTPPPGLVAKLAGTLYCSEAALAAATTKSGAAEQANPSCPASSQVGTVEVGAGAGPAPYYVTGRAYLMGPYKGAPLSLGIVTPATAGPYDLGTVVVRVALHVDPATTQITADSDRLPTILQGIPLDIRSVTVKMDKPRFTTNPTSCDPMSVTGSLLSTFDSVASLQNPFQVGACGNLGFKPKLSLRLFGGIRRTDHPRLRAVLTMPDGDANVSRASVALPHSEFLEQAHIDTVCTRVQFAADACPKGSVYGHARAFSPLLDQPLEGPVYLRSSSHELPDMVADLKGQIRVALVGRIDSSRGGIRTTFEAVPDAAVSKFVLTMQGGKKGLLVNSTNICRRAHRAAVQFDAHNGRASDSRPQLKAKCPRKRKHSAHTRRGHRKGEGARHSGRADLR
jgi:hypothetical protein